MMRPRPLLLLSVLASSCLAARRRYTFAVVPKSLDSKFFDPTRDACMNISSQLSSDDTEIVCLYTGPPNGGLDEDGSKQAAIIRELVDSKTVQGLAVSVRNASEIKWAIDFAVQTGVPVVTFDSDAPQSMRKAYIGTDNYFFGSEMANVLKKLRPSGGTIGLVATKAGNLVERVRGFVDEIESDGAWTLIDGEPSDMKENISLAMEQMNEFARRNATAIVPMVGIAMLHDGWLELVKDYPDILRVAADDLPKQLDYLQRSYVNGLVGQLPYDMGQVAIESLYKLVVDGEKLQSDSIGTNVLQHVMVPLVLPTHVVDHNLIGDLQALGYLLFAFIAASAAGFSYWTWKNRNVRVVKLAQPLFLHMTALGVVVMAATLIPLTRDDSGEENSLNERQGQAICMSIPWCGFCGFTLTFSALFSKLKRVNRIFRAQFGRTKVTPWEVMKPFMLLFSANLVLLTMWTIVDPLMYERNIHEGTDGWSRILSTYGSCQSDNAVLYLVPLAILNLGVLVMANWQAYTARKIESEFSESKYIALTMAVLLQVTVLSIPIVFVVDKNPQALYLLLVFMIFIISMAVLLLMFVPKMVLAKEWRLLNETGRSERIERSVRLSVLHNTTHTLHCPTVEGEIDEVLGPTPYGSRRQRALARRAKVADRSLSAEERKEASASSASSGGEKLSTRSALFELDPQCAQSGENESDSGENCW